MQFDVDNMFIHYSLPYPFQLHVTFIDNNRQVPIPPFIYIYIYSIICLFILVWSCVLKCVQPTLLINLFCKHVYQIFSSRRHYMSILIFYSLNDYVYSPVKLLSFWCIAHNCVCSINIIPFIDISFLERMSYLCFVCINLDSIHLF